MVLGLPVVLAIAAALVFGGDLRRLSGLRLRRIELFYVAIAVQLVAFPFAFMPWRVSDAVARALWLASYAALCCGAVANLRITGVPIIGAGMAANIIAVVANGGHMPALPRALHDAGKSYVVQYNSAASATPHVSWLVDRWAVPDWLPVGNVFSVGDVVIAIGVMVLVFSAMGARLPLALPRRAAETRG
jgi:hypothetical protein